VREPLHALREDLLPGEDVLPAVFRAGNGGDDPAAREGQAHLVLHRPSIVPGVPTPYAFGYVELECGLIVYALLADWSPPEEKLKPGMQVEQVVEWLRDDEAGNPIVTFKYRPVIRR